MKARVWKFLSHPQNWFFYLVAFALVSSTLYTLRPRANHSRLREVNNSLVLEARALEQEYGNKVTFEDTKPLPPAEIRKELEADNEEAHLQNKVLSVPILMYHHVGSEPENSDGVRHDLTVSGTDFETEVAWLSRSGYASVTLDQIYQAIQGNFVLPKKPVVVTFDDGYSDVFETAVPILQKYSFIGSFAVIGGFVGNPDYATWDQIRRAKEMGMEIVSHTYDHFDGSNPKYDKEFIQKNLELSLETLDKNVGKVPRILVYPYGHYTPLYIETAKEVGFVMGLTVHFGKTVDPANLLETPRVRVHGGESLERFVENVTGQK